jgi:DNA-binding response OmpR family regulator
VTFVFKNAGCEVESCGQEACLKLIHEEKFSAIVLDNHYHGLKDVEICQEIRSVDQEIPVIFLSDEVRQAEDR